MSVIMFILFSVLAISASTFAQDLFDVNSQSLTRAEDCSPEAIAECLISLTSLIGKDDDDDKESCDVARTTYYCLKNKADACLDSPAQEDIKNDLDQMKNLLTPNCQLKETDACIDDETEKVKDCAYSGIATAVFNFRKTGANDFERFQCWAYMEMMECFIRSLKKNCGLSATNIAMKRLVNLPPHIKESCKIAPFDHSITTIYGFGN